ncbi:hypothetical protein CEXT_151451 [Caerostris extrusa]|uniref:Uncharacterized protein n=1 Tax=Caerostris extrusa TaxID=172846 RepID=A0AAV4TA96_CAEEX|nr:hypothetical protein CEXT_151451 [Caerostris extrusa]
MFPLANDFYCQSNIFHFQRTRKISFFSENQRKQKDQDRRTGVCAALPVSLQEVRGETLRGALVRSSASSSENDGTGVRDPSARQAETSGE